MVVFLFASYRMLSQTYDITITIPDLKNNNGEIFIGLFNNAATFPDDDGQYKTYRTRISSLPFTYTLTALPAGTYAVALYHDENADKKCNRNFFGIPTEGYAFSQNVKPVFTAPKFSECKVLLNTNVHLYLHMIY